MSYQEQVTQDAFAQSGSTYGGSSPTSWASASGSGTATYNESDTFTPFSSGSSGSNGGSSSGSGWASAFSSWDNWSQSSFSSYNQVAGKEWSASVSGSGPATLPSIPTASYGPSSQANPGFSPSPYYTGANRYNLNNLGSPPSNSDGHLGPSTSYNGPMFEGGQLGGGLSLDSPLPVGDGQGEGASKGSAPAPCPTFTHDPAGNLTSLTDPDGNTTTWTYNSQGNVSSETISSPLPSGEGQGEGGSAMSTLVLASSPTTPPAT